MAARKSRLYLNSFLPVTRTHDEVVTNIFRSGKFACTVTGNLQLVGIISLCANLAIIIVSDYCPYHPCNRKLNIGTAVTTISCATALYFIFCGGYIVSNPSLWVRINIVTNLILSTITIVAQSMAMKVCLTVTKIHKSPGPIAIVGGSCLLLSCFTLFLLYRYTELDIEINDIIKERRISEDRSAIASNSHRKVSFISNTNSQIESPSPNHIQGQIYIKYEDNRRRASIISNNSNCQACHSDHRQNTSKRKNSAYSRHDEPIIGQAHAHNQGHTQGAHGYHGKCTRHSRNNVSNDVTVGVHSNSYYHDDYPHCPRRKTSLYAKHI